MKSKELEVWCNLVHHLTVCVCNNTSLLAIFVPHEHACDRLNDPWPPPNSIWQMARDRRTLSGAHFL